jgi:hypothetical protein
MFSLNREVMVCSDFLQGAQMLTPALVVGAVIRLSHVAR